MAQMPRMPQNAAEFEAWQRQMSAMEGQLPNFNMNNINFSDPSSFFDQLKLPKPKSMPTPANARQEARERATEVAAHWKTLHRILERYEDVLRKRWLKKSSKQRKTILLTAWPNMPLNHRPDYEAFQKEKPEQRSQGTRFKEAYTWPYINLEDLARNKALLLFLNSRARHQPAMFAHADFEAVHLGHVSGAIMPPFLNEYTMYLDEKTYGKLVSWDDDDDAFEMMISGRGFQPGQGLMILEIQHRILAFLVKCCEIILHDFVEAGSLLDDKIPIKEEPAPLAADPESWPTMASIAAEAPYRLPANLDFARLQMVIAAKREAAEDHIYALREDPGYFADVLGDRSEHRAERIRDSSGKLHPVGPDKPLFWERVLSSVVSNAYVSFMVWNLIGQQLTQLSNLKEKFRHEISPRKALPKEYMNALLVFQKLLDRSSLEPIQLLKGEFPSSPSQRSKYARLPSSSPNSMSLKLISKDGQSNLEWLLATLCNEDQRFLFSLPGLIDELEYCIQNDPTEKQKFSGWIASVLADLGVIAWLRHELDIYQPWAAGMDYAYGEKSNEIDAEVTKLTTPISATFESIGGEMIAATKFGILTDGRFAYPSDKRRTKQNVEQMRRAEQHLDMFWEKFNVLFKARTSKSLDSMLGHRISGLNRLERTPEWVEPIITPKTKSETGESLSEPFSQLGVHNEDRFKPQVSPPKPKPKTRGAPTVLESPTLEEPEPQPDKQPTFKVDKRALKVFTALFHNPNNPDQPGEIAWKDFLWAMASTGFAPEKLYGSIWQFSPTILDVERSIQFHEPHPHSKIPFRNARRIGRRLARAYGWRGDMFSLA